MREKISKLTLNLQNQDIVPLWAVANDNLICNTATNQKHQWKNKSKKIYYIMKIASALKISDGFIFLFGFYGVLKLWSTVYKNNARNKEKTVNYTKIFVGHSANAEDFLFNEYAKKINLPVLKINIITLDGLDKIGSPSLRSLFFPLFKHSFGLSKKIKKLSKKLNLNALDFLTQSSLNISQYVFFRSFFKLARLNGVDEVGFLSLYLGAHACLHENIKVIYYSHGLMRLSIVMIKANYVYTVTPEEKKYIDCVFNNSITCEVIKKYKRISEKKQNIILIMPPETFSFYPESAKVNFLSFLDWARSLDFKIILRPSPKISNEDFLIFTKEYPVFYEIDNGSADLELKLKELKPKYVVSQNTTGFYIALSLGILPVSICDPINDFHIYDNIYPIMYRSLFWPRDSEIIKSACENNLLYEKQIELLKNASDKELFPNDEKVSC